MTTAGNKPNVPSGPLSSVTSQPNASNISTASVSGSSGRTARATVVEKELGKFPNGLKLVSSERIGVCYVIAQKLLIENIIVYAGK